MLPIPLRRYRQPSNREARVSRQMPVDGEGATDRHCPSGSRVNRVGWNQENSRTGVADHPDFDQSIRFALALYIDGRAARQMLDAV